MKKPLLALLIALPLGAVQSAPPASGSANCVAPEQPYCLYDSVIYDDQARYSACKQQVDRYSASSKQYLDCLQKRYQAESDALAKNQQTEYDGAIQAANMVVERFNCMGKKQPKCY